MPTNNAADTLNAPLTFNGSPFVVNSAVINIGTSGSVTTFQGTVNLPPSLNGWLLSGNSGTNPATNYIGSSDAEDVVFKANAVEVFRMVNSDGSLQIANNGTLPGFSTGVIEGSSNSGALTLYGSPSQSGGQITLTGSSSPQPNAVACVADASFFITSITSPPYVLISPAGIKLGNGSFGNAIANVITFEAQSTNPTSIGSGGMVFVGSDTNLYYLNTTSTYQLTGLSNPWSITGNSVSNNSSVLGTTNSFGWSIISANVTVAALDALQNVNWTPSSFSVVSTGNQVYDVPVGNPNSINIGNSNLTVLNIGNANCSITSLSNTSTLDATSSFTLAPSATSVTIGGSTAVTTMTASIFTLNSSGGMTLTEATANLNVSATTGTAYFDGVTVNIATSLSTNTTIGYGANYINFSGLSATYSGEIASFTSTANTALSGPVCTVTGSSSLDLESPQVSIAVAGTSTQLLMGNSACASTLTTTTFTLSSNGGLTLIEATAAVNITATAGALNLTSAGGATYFDSTSLLIEAVSGANYIQLNSSGMDIESPTITIGTANTSTQVSIDSTSNVLIAPANCTNLAFGNAATQSSIVGTQFQASLSVAFIADAPSCEFANSAATNATIGNTSCDLNINSAQANILGVTYVNVDSSTEVQIAQSSATILQISNPSCACTFDGTSLKIPNVGVSPGAVAVPAHTPPAGYNYLAVNSTTGAIIQFAA